MLTSRPPRDKPVGGLPCTMRVRFGTGLVPLREKTLHT